MKYVLLEFTAEIRVNEPLEFKRAIAAFEAVLLAIDTEQYLTNDGKQTDAYNVVWSAMIVVKSEEQANYIAKLLADLSDLFEAATTAYYFGIEERMINATELSSRA